MQRLLVGIVILALVGFLVRVIAIGSTISALNDTATLAMLKTPPGFTDVSEGQDCPLSDYCFRTPGLLRPMTRPNASGLITQFGLTVSDIGCQSSAARTQNGALRCTGEGTLTDVNGAAVNVFFSVISGPDINAGRPSSQLGGAGTYAAFTTKAMQRLPLALRFA